MSLHRFAIAVALLLPAPALACGGFFCSSSELIAVEQERERILFEVNPDGTLTIVVEIGYVGAPEGFAWILPVPETPTLGTAPASSMLLLDAVTAPSIVPPSIYWNWEDDGDSSTGGDDDDAAGDDDDDDDDVIVEDLPQVGPYDPTVVSSDDPEALIDWLNDNGYLITTEMEPYVAGYVAQGMKFLGLRLAPGSAVQDVAPIAVTYTGTVPSIPLTLTGVSAAPEMSFLVFVAGEGRFGPQNWSDLEVPTDLLQADPRTGANNYYPLISYLADLEGGRAFFTEASGVSEDMLVDATWMSLGFKDDEESRQWLLDLMERQPYLTRMFTRASAEELLSDPIFAASQGGAVSGRHELGGEVCWDTIHTPTVPCAETYCGVGGVCGVTAEGESGCACGETSLARAITAPNVSSVGAFPSVTCQDSTVDLLASVVGPAPVDPCGGVSCGDFGECVVHAGFPTCACTGGFIAVPDGVGFLTCEPAVEVFEPEQVLWGTWPPPVDGCGEPTGDDDDVTGDDDDATGDDDDDATGDDGDDDTTAADDDDTDSGNEVLAPACATAGGSAPALVWLVLAALRRRGPRRV